MSPADWVSGSHRTTDTNRGSIVGGFRVCDNQGTSSLLEQDCTVILVSDGSGQMESEDKPGTGLLGVPLRSNTILQARVREAQYHELSARQRASLLRGFMFVHLKDDLDVDPIDWIGCLDPYDASDDSRPAYRRGPLTVYTRFAAFIWTVAIIVDQFRVNIFAERKRRGAAGKPPAQRPCFTVSLQLNPGRTP